MNFILNKRIIYLSQLPLLWQFFNSSHSYICVCLISELSLSISNFCRARELTYKLTFLLLIFIHYTFLLAILFEKKIKAGIHQEQPGYIGRGLLFCLSRYLGSGKYISNWQPMENFYQLTKGKVPVPPHLTF